LLDTRDLVARDVGARDRKARDLGARDLAGYRVLRSLASDQDAEVLLGHRSAIARDGDSVDDRGTGPLRPTEVQTVAIKRSPASDSAWQTALRECAALERARGDHVVDLLDMDADDESIRLIFERLPRGDLAELLSIRPRLDAGEAVTVLAPIASTLLRMHAAGVAHGNLSASTVLFREDGAPTLIGFSNARLFEPGAPEVVLEQVDAVGRDRAALGTLAALVLGRVDGARSRAARELIADLQGCDDESVLPLLASRLFEVAAAVPVRFEPDVQEADTSPSAWRAIPVGVVADGSIASPAEQPSSHWTTAVARLVPEPLVQRVVDTVEGSTAAPAFAAAAKAISRRWGAWTAGRRRLVLAVVAAAVTVVIAMAVAPSGAAGKAPVAAPSASRSASSSSGTSSSDEQPGGSSPSVSGDDPLAAVSWLVSVRDRCLRSLSVPCLDRVDEGGSSALSNDQSTIRVAEQGGELPDPLPAVTSDRPAVLIERLGDSALVRLGQAASTVSLLLVKGDGGWRIRDVVVAGATVPGTPAASPSPNPTAG